MKKVTMQNIADELGISKMSVSKCFQGSDEISVELKEKILEKAAAMGYVYHSRDKKKITVLLAERFLDPADTFYSRILRKFNTLSGEYQMDFTIRVIGKPEERGCYLPEGLDASDGIILLGQMARRYVECVRQLGKPTICVDFEWWGIGLDTVVSNNYSASFNLTMYLVRRGHRKIAFVGNLNSTNSIDDRYLGYRKALIQSGIAYREEYQINEMDAKYQRIAPALPQDMPTAFVCNNDFCAFLLIKRLQKDGYRIPEDISVVGFDNAIYSRVSNPEITTINIPTESMSKRAVKQLSRRIADPGRPVSTSNVECDLIEGHSVADVKEPLPL